MLFLYFAQNRQACAIESAAKWNPNHDVFVLFASKVGFPDVFDSPLIAALQSYPNIYFRNLNFTEYSAATPMEDWLRTDQLFLSNYLVSHTSDFLRYTSMFKFGGIYLDLDVVVQQTLEMLPLNFAAAESVNFVAIGAFGFQPDDIGHEIAELCTKWLYSFSILLLIHVCTQIEWEIKISFIFLGNLRIISTEKNGATMDRAY